jgi:hypothetical protein
MPVTSSDGRVKWIERNVQLEELEPGVQIAKPHKFMIRPSPTGVTYRVNGKHKILSKHGHFITTMGRPTLTTSLRVNISDEYEGSATKADAQNGNYWEYNHIFMRGDHVTVRWRRHGGRMAVGLHGLRDGGFWAVTASS